MKTPSGFKALPFAARLAISVFVLFGIATVLYAVAAFGTALAPVRVMLLLAAAGLGSRAKVNLFKGSTLSFLTSVVLLAVIQEGLVAALIVAIFGVTVQVVSPSKKVVVHQVAFNAGMIAVTVTAAWWSHHWLIISNAVYPISAELMATVLASFIYFLGNSLSVSLIISLTKRVSMVDIWLNHFLSAAPSFLIAGLLSLAVIAMINNGMALVFALVAVVSVAYYSSVRTMAARVPVLR